MVLLMDRLLAVAVQQKQVKINKPLQVVEAVQVQLQIFQILHSDIVAAVEVVLVVVLE